MLCFVCILLPLAPQPTVGFGLSDNVLPFFSICHQLCPSSHSHHLKILSTSSFHLFLGLSLLFAPSSDKNIVAINFQTSSTLKDNSFFFCFRYKQLTILCWSPARTLFHTMMILRACLNGLAKHMLKTWKMIMTGHSMRQCKLIRKRLRLNTDEF